MPQPTNPAMQGVDGYAPLTKAKIGFVLPHEQFPVPELVRNGSAAEAAGFDMVWTSDHFHPWQDNEGHAGFAWITLAALGQRVNKLVMGTGVTCPTYRYRPQLVAEAFASLSLLYPGRIFLGVGSGEALNEVPAGGGWGPYAERAERLKEAVTIIRKLWSGEWVNYQGQYYDVQNARLYDTPQPMIPIYIAASASKSMRLAGQHGDGLITDAQRAIKPELRQAFEEGARSAGKDPATMPVLAEHMVVVGDQAEAERYAELWRFMPKAWDEHVTDPDPREIQRTAEQDTPLDKVYGQWPVSADPQVHIDAIQKLIDKGVSHIFVHSPQPDQQSVIRFFGEQVLPKLRLDLPHALAMAV